MNHQTDRAFGVLLRRRRTEASLSQRSLSRRMKWPQATLSRVEQGQRSVTLPELLSVAKAFNCSANELLAGLESAASKEAAPETGAGSASVSPAFAAAWSSEEVLLSHLARFGVRFLGSSPKPSLSTLPLDETVLAALRRMDDPRVFEALPGLLLNNAERVDWHKLTAGAYSLGFQNRLGAVLATALQLKSDDATVERRVWDALRSAHDSLAQGKLDREEVVGTRPQTEAALALLRQRTPEWLRFWHVLGSGDLSSARRCLRR